MKITINAVLSMPGTVAEVLEKVEAAKGQKVTKEEAEAHFRAGVNNLMNRETDDDTGVESVECQFTED